MLYSSPDYPISHTKLVPLMELPSRSSDQTHQKIITIMWTKTGLVQMRLRILELFFNPAHFMRTLVPQLSSYQSYSFV